MPASPEITLELTPRRRLDLIDVNGLLREQHGDVLAPYPRALYASYHTTAGYFEQPLCRYLGDSPDSLLHFVQRYRHLYPEGAGYRHDQLEYRTELTEEQKQSEPLNGDSHLTYIGSGLMNCVTYDHRPGAPAYFIDLDGVYGTLQRTRRTTVIGFHREVVADCLTLEVPVSSHRIDSFNLRDPRLGLIEQLAHHAERLGIAKGRVDLRLHADEQDAALTVNEFETLLMQHDLREVLRNPFRFMAQKGWHVLRDPLSVPDKALNYAKYDLVQVVNRTLDKLRLRGTPVEHFFDRFLGRAAARRLKMKRRVSLPISDHDRDGRGEIVQGTYQSPILIQWLAPRNAIRKLDVRFVAFD